MSSKESFELVKDIITKSCERRTIVVSALGKTTNFNEKITDKLIKCFENNRLGKNVKTEFDEIETRYIELSSKLGNNSLKKEMFTRLYGELLSGTPFDYFVSRGEYFSAKLLSKYLGYEFIDAKDIITYKNNYTVNTSKIKGKNVVISGFYANDGYGNIKLFNRGGSDLTGSLIAKSLCEKYENWTDVDGIKINNPNVSKSDTVAEIGYKQLYSLSGGGSNVFSKDAVIPLIGRTIVTEIHNTFNQNGKYTTVSGDIISNKGLIGIADKELQNGKTLVTIITGGVNKEIQGLDLIWTDNYTATAVIDSIEIKQTIEKIKEEYNERYR